MGFVASRLLGIDRDTVVSPLGRDACFERLRAASDGPFSLLGSRPALATVIGSQLWLKRRRSLFSRNPLRTVMYVDFETRAEGTAIICRSRPTLLSMAAMGLGVFLGGLVAFIALGLVLMQLPTGEGLAGALVTLGFVVAYIVIVIVTRLAWEEDQHYELVTFIMRTTQAAPVLKQALADGIVR